jgi:hypothetical protein
MAEGRLQPQIDKTTHAALPAGELKIASARLVEALRDDPAAPVTFRL